jgi:hypothetical protein
MASSDTVVVIASAAGAATAFASLLLARSSSTGAVIQTVLDGLPEGEDRDSVLLPLRLLRRVGARRSRSRSSSAPPRCS